MAAVLIFAIMGLTTFACLKAMSNAALAKLRLEDQHKQNARLHTENMEHMKLEHKKINAAEYQARLALYSVPEAWDPDNPLTKERLRLASGGSVPK